MFIDKTLNEEKSSNWMDLITAKELSDDAKELKADDKEFDEENEKEKTNESFLNESVFDSIEVGTRFYAIQATIRTINQVINIGKVNNVGARSGEDWVTFRTADRKYATHYMVPLKDLQQLIADQYFMILTEEETKKSSLPAKVNTKTATSVKEV